jgi:hypothetical protein
VKQASAQPFVFHDRFELERGGELSLADAMSTYWTNFASSGDPNRWSGPRLPPPPPLPRGRRWLEAAAATKSPPPPPRARRPSNWTHWWMLPNLDCDSGIEEGSCQGGSSRGGVAHCKAKCLADPYCGGFNSNFHEKHVSCWADLERSQHTPWLLVLHATPQPPPPPPPPPSYQLPRRCVAFERSSECYPATAAYASVPIPPLASSCHSNGVYRQCAYDNTSALARCCAACAAAGPGRCARWVVPAGPNATRCLLLRPGARPLPPSKVRDS